MGNFFIKIIIVFFFLLSLVRAETLQKIEISGNKRISDQTIIIFSEIKSINFNNSYELQFIPLGDCDLTSEGSITLNSKTINIEPLTGKWTIN